MGRWHRDELEEAFDKYREAARKGSSTGDWEDWVNCFTPDGTYIEHVDGDFWGRDSIRKWINELMAPWPICEMTAFIFDWYTIDEDKGWIITRVMNRMNDLGDGRIYEERNMTILRYAGNGMFSGQEDVYNPANFEKMITEWVMAKLEKSTPEEQERLGKELEKTLAARAKVQEGGISALDEVA
jgi:hypothetical protein